MPFLYKIFLPVLVAAAIPILLHLLNRFRLPVVEFSSIEFLKRLQKKKSRRIKLRQLILLILRTLAIIAVVLVFARPALQSGNAADSAAAVETIIVLDDGLNSGAESRDGQILRIAAGRAIDIAELNGSDDQLTLILTSQPSRSITTPASQVDLIKNRLENLESSYIPPNLNETWNKIDSIFSSTDRFNRELYIVSNLYATRWDSIDWEEPGKTEKRFIVPVGPDHLENISVDKVTLTSTIIHSDRPVELTAELRNHSGNTVQDALVGVYLDGQRTALASVDIPPNSSITQTFSVTPTKTGSLAGSVKLEDMDPFNQDNRRNFILEVPDSLHVLVVAPDSATSRILEAVFNNPASGFIKITAADPRRWEAEPFNSYNCLLLAGINSMSNGVSDRVADFVKRGGGVIIFQGPRADLANLNRGLWQKLGFTGSRGVVERGGISWGNIDLKHPIFKGIFEDRSAPRFPMVDFLVDLIPNPSDQVVIPLSDGHPFLLERQIGKGKALMFSVSLGLESGDFIYTGIFAPLLFRSVSYSSISLDETDWNWLTGLRQRIFLPVQNAVSIQMTLPDNETVDIPPRPVIGGVEYDAGLIEVPGIYLISVNNSTVIRYAANIPTSESTLIRRDIEALSNRLYGASVIDKDSKDLSTLIYSARFGRELWRPLAILFIILLVLESTIGRSWRKSTG